MNPHWVLKTCLISDYAMQSNYYCLSKMLLRKQRFVVKKNDVLTLRVLQFLFSINLLLLLLIFIYCLFFTLGSIENEIGNEAITKHHRIEVL